MRRVMTEEKSGIYFQVQQMSELHTERQADWSPHQICCDPGERVFQIAAVLLAFDVEFVVARHE